MAGGGLDRPLLFLHIPKTGGTTLRLLLESRFDPAEVLHVAGSEAQRLEQTARLSDYRLVTGHVGFGIARRFPCFPLVVTLLRDPIARAVSAYGHLRSMNPDLEREGLRREIDRAKGHDLLGYIESDPAAAADHLGNVQTWHLAKDGVRRRDVAKLTAADLGRARDNLRLCASVGSTERLSAFLESLSSTLSWQPFENVPHANAGVSGLSVDELDSRTLSALTALTGLDSELYRSVTLGDFDASHSPSGR